MTRLTAAAILLALGMLVLSPHSLQAQGGEWGTVKGQVVLDGPIPKLPPLKVDKDQAHCLSKGPIPDETWVVNPKNKGVRWTFVWLQPEKGARPLSIHPSLQKLKTKEVVMDQPICKFEPRVLGMRQGQVLLVKNSAPIPHNVNYQAIRNPSNNVLLPPGASHKVENLRADRFPLAVACNIHGWMKAYVRIFDHPYFAVTNENGAFEIKNAPAGKFRLITWHETGWGPGGRDGIEIAIAGGKVTEVKLELKAK